MNNKFMLIGIILMITGAYLSFGYARQGAIILADTTEPVITGTWPANGQVYGVPGATVRLYVYCYDYESGVKSADMTVDGTVYHLTCGVNGSLTGTYSWNLQITGWGQGSHTFSALVVNGVGLSSTVQGSFQVYVTLTGTWYINNIVITDATQIIPVTSLNVNFKFVKTSGLADSSITCSVYEGATKLCDLTNSAASTWTGTYTITPGSHVVSLKAFDGTSTITMGIVDLNYGVSSMMDVSMMGNIMMIAGALITGFGFAKQRKVKT
jgi:hypothetical protein